MIHELLLALSGYPGSIFTWNKRSGLQVSQDFPFLHPSETSVLNRLCRLGTDYMRFTEFIEQYTGHVQQQVGCCSLDICLYRTKVFSGSQVNSLVKVSLWNSHGCHGICFVDQPSLKLTEMPAFVSQALQLKDHHPSQQGQGGLHGIYLRAFCTGLDSVLQPYRQALLDLEQEFLADTHLSISHVNYSLDQFQLLFPSVMVVVEQIKSQKIHGCQILETVYKHSCGGLPPVRSALEKILAVCHGVMYKQLSAWMLHGLLLDQHEEFFIKQGPSSGNINAQAEEDEEDLGIGGLTGKQLRELQDLRLIEEENMLAPSLKQFSLRVEILPSYIPVRVAEKILFVGESVQMFENQNVNLTRKGSILKNQEDTFAAELHRLKQQPLFSLVDFEQVVDRIRSTVAEHLWKLMVEESDLLGQLKIIKDFYLLGRGELFQAFIDTAQHMLKTPPTAVTEHDVNVAFQQSAHKVLLDDDNLLPLLHLTIEYHGKDHKDATQPREGPSRETSPREAPASGWAALGLSYKVQWPLHILFTPAVLEKYNVVFKYLLSVRRVQAELQHCWALQMQRKHLKSNQTDAVKWRLRNHMAFLVDNLQYYLQVDVLESQFSQLLHQINSTRDFESIRLAHDHFLSNLLAQSFILLKPVFHCLNEILDLCHSFCSLVSQNLGPLDERGAAQLSILVKKFKQGFSKDSKRLALCMVVTAQLSQQGFSRQSSLLFKILSSVRNHQINSDLAQLLLRLDYNKYYTQAGGTLGSFGM
ncbi:gamma-tubulin complex component 4 isoform X3 [Cricetulus griseus]|uniref:Gamma-tubulin complex component n=1 Tax=Cricetulus griseus TaxID=10029 RepID=A0A9J7JLU6_CRIGR|nr:gamma-tubulin complex component 4 isoform X9 [Cricetulus griseus]XP_035300669.1 gamma-tubulin complex component 4 isoform X3 [Cricetulus griseus]